MDQVVNACIDYLKDNHNLAPNTLASYERDIRQYTAYLKNLGILDTQLADKELLAGYIQSLNACGKSPSTVSRCVASLRIFYRYLIRHGKVNGNPIIGIEAPKITKKPPKILSEQEVHKLMEVPGTTGVKNIRDKAIIELLYETGLKVTELISLNVEHLDFEQGCIRCVQGRKNREVEIKSACMEGLADYLKLSRPFLLKDSQERSLFINSSGKRISRQGIWKIIKKYTRMADMEDGVTPYTLRHTLAADLIRKGGNAKEVQRVLGNSTKATLEKYNTLLNES
ncbi:MAG: tyrosine-type recombinase/integrase [Clostridia bacterium]|nr:tyrosine-type recombinase/integrase [Clostridia bacterium]